MTEFSANANLSSSPPDNNCLAANIRHLRKSQNFSQEELALRIGLNRGNIASYENGAAEPNVCNILKFANLFRVNVFDLLGKSLEASGIQKCTKATTSPAATDTQPQPDEVLAAFSERAVQLANVLQSFHTCHSFKLQSLETMPREMQILAINFEGLFEAAQALLREHTDLITYRSKAGS